MSLPINGIFSALTEQLASQNRVILQAPPGAGKSTRLPILLLETGHYSPNNQIYILEPRRVAARQIAQYLAKQLGEKVGKTIGLKMRGENKTSADTVLTIVTDGVMVRQIQSDPELENIGLIVFDEFHERALQTDLSLALVLDAQELNDEVKVLIMSATLDLQKLSEQLDAPIVESAGRQFPVDINYVSSALIPSDDEIIKAIGLAVSEHSSSVLVFLSGVGEIKRVQNKLEQKLQLDASSEIDVLPLYGGLTIEQQVSAIEPCPDGQRKIVLATNIAQTSLTIEGVDVVVDSGVERIVQYNHKLASEQLITQPISIAAATQRAGRAGRLRAGVCYRLGNKEQFERRRNFDVAEIERVDLSLLLLEIQLWGAQFYELFWLSQPESTKVKLGQQKLVNLGYIEPSSSKLSATQTHSSVTETSSFKLMPLASEYQKLPLDLRFTKMMLAAQRLVKQQKGVESSKVNFDNLIATACILVTYLQQSRFSEQANLVTQLEYLSSAQWHAIKDQAQSLARRVGLSKIDRSQLDVEHLGLLVALAFPDRIGKKQGKQWKLSNGAGVTFHASQTASKAELIVVSDFNASEYGQFISQFADVESADIQRFIPDLITEVDGVFWSDTKQKPERSQQQVIGELVLSEKPLPLNINNDEWQQLWLSMVADKGWKVLTYSDGVDKLIKKMALVRRFVQQEAWPDFSKAVLIETSPDWLAPYLSGIKSLQQLKALNIAKILLDSIDWNLQQKLQSLCPDVYKTPAGNNRNINYDGDAPKLSVKLQEMFGEPTTPTICNGQVKLTLELLSPAKRPLQLTNDLANFWQNAYIEVKKEMKGRYPKHPWPDDPTTFVATNKTKSQLARTQNRP